MKKPTWMPCYITDYLRDTTRLTTEGHGAYLLLIFDYWVQGQPLPDDDAQLAAITRMSLPKWKTLRPTLARFFQIGDGVWRHKRVDRELALASERLSKMSEGGKRARAVKSIPHTSLDAMEDTMGACIPHCIPHAPQLTGSEAAQGTIHKSKTNLPLSNRETNSAREGGEGSFSKLGGGDPSGRSAPLAADAALKEKRRNLLISKVTRFATAKIADPEVAIAGLMGDDPDHDEQWWLDHLDRLMKAQRWDDTTEEAA